MSNLLILERSGDTLSQQYDNNHIILQGTFTQFGIKNKNGRIYEEKEFMPHLKELQEKVKKGKLLGELDHPTKFDISLQNVSHVIEELEYDSSKKQVIGKIKLLNTDKGKQAQALVEAGVPLHISSRAAGNVGANGNVTIQKLFTYDLVADPGFAAAELNRVNESLGFREDENLFIYEIDESEIDNTTTYKSKKIENMNNYVTAEDFNLYSEYIKEQFESLNSRKESAQFNKLIEYTDHLAENLNKLFKYTEYLGENLDSNISHNDYIAEKIDSIKEYCNYLSENGNNSIFYSEYMAKQTNKLVEYVDYISKQLDKNISYSEYLAENQNSTINYANYLAEKVDQNMSYSEYLAENQNSTINYANYLAEKVDQNVSYGEYLAENQNNMINYSEYIKENVENIGKYANYLAENINGDFEDTPSVKSHETIENSSNKSIISKIDSILETVKNKNIQNDVDDKHFMRFLDSTKRNEFESLNEDVQNKIVETFANSKYMSFADANKIWDSCFVNAPYTPTLNYIDNMPSKYRSLYESLSSDKKNAIYKQSKVYPLETQYQIDNFWQTRDLRPAQFKIEKINENENAVGLEEKSPAGVSLQVVNDVRDALNARFKNI